MKKYILIASSAVLTLTGCVDYDDATKPISATVQLVMPEEFTQGADFEGHTVTLTGTDGTIYTATTDALGQAHFSELTPLQYTVSTSWSIDVDTYNRLTGSQSTNAFATVTGTRGGVIISEQNASIDLSTNLAVASALVISKVYYTGCKDNNNKNYIADKYIELYNQSDEAINVGKLYLGTGDPNSKPWTAELIAAEHPGYTPLAQIFQIPEEERMLEPGEAVVIALSAIDHSQYTPTSPNLVEADYDTDDTRGRFTNNPDVTDLTLTYSMWPALSYLNLVNGGPVSVVIFRSDENPASWQTTYGYSATRGNELLLMPNETVVDAVEFLKYNNNGPVDATQKRLVATLDAGFANASTTSGVNGEVMVRKPSGSTGAKGQLILTDTNNSTNDFTVSTTIKPRQYEE